MKNFYSFFLSLVTLLSIISCEKENPQKENLSKDTDVIDVRLSLCGDVSFIDEPLTRAWGSDNSAYGIKVYEYNENTSDYESYAYGIFASTSNLSIKLLTSKKYKFEAAYLKNFTDRYSFIDSNQYKPYTDVTDGFIYGSNYFWPYCWGELSSNKKTDIIESDFYYGSISDYVPTASCSIPLYRKTFGIDLTVTGMTEGSIVCSLSNMKGANGITSMSIDYPTTTLSKLFGWKEFIQSNSVDWWLEINYIDPAGSEHGIVCEQLTFSICTRKKISLTLKANEPSESTSNVAISLSEDNLVDESLNYEGTI